MSIWHQWIFPNGLMLGFEFIPDELLALNGDKAGIVLDLLVVRIFFAW